MLKVKNQAICYCKGDFSDSYYSCDNKELKKLVSEGWKIKNISGAANSHGEPYCYVFLELEC